MNAPPLAGEEVLAFLEARYGPVRQLERLGGGFWSTAYGFALGDRELVVRFGADRSWFEAERLAMAFTRPGLPVPTILEIGEVDVAGEAGVDGGAAGRFFAVSERHHGVYLESVRRDQVDHSGPTLGRLLEALFSVPKSPDLPVGWYGSSSTPTWREWLRDSLEDRADRPVHGWRTTLAADKVMDGLFRAAEGRMVELLDACPERRDLVHRDLLHGNVLVTEDARDVTAVFSWKCSVRGDFLYDVAWCTFWGGLHQGIAATNPFRLALSSPVIAAEPDALVDAAIRHHCYEIHIGAEHLAWYVWVDNRLDLAKTAEMLAAVLERGPRIDSSDPPSGSTSGTRVSGGG